MWLAAFAVSLAVHAGVGTLLRDSAPARASAAASTPVPIIMQATTLEDVDTVATVAAAEPAPVPQSDAAPVAAAPEAAAGEGVPPIDAAEAPDAPPATPAAPAAVDEVPDEPAAPPPDAAVVPDTPAAGVTPEQAAEAGEVPAETAAPAAAEPATPAGEVAKALQPSDTAAAVQAVAEVPVTEAVESAPAASAAVAPTDVPAEAARQSRPEDPTIPFPFMRPPPGERIATLAPEDADKLERMPVPPAHPTPAAERAAAYARWQAAEAKRQALEAERQAAEAARHEERAAAERRQAAKPSGGGGSRTGARRSGQAEAAYGQVVRSVIAANFERATRRVRGAGTARVAVTVARNGRVVRASLSARSGNAAIDSAALNAARTHFAAFSADITRDSLTFVLPLTLR